jgi:hypothetical protein
LKTMGGYKVKFNNWTLLQEEISILKRKVKDGEIPQSILEAFINPLQNE